MFNAHADPPSPLGGFGGPERQRRIQQIEEFLLRMGKRFRKNPDDDLFLIFNEEEPHRDPGQKKNRVAKSLSIPAFAAIGEGAGFAEAAGDTPAEDWQGGDAPRRFMQWCFSPDWFFLELPSTTLDPAEAERILRDRSGFRFIGSAQPLGYKPATVEKFNPFVKFYLYGDERIAAEDAAHIWFDVWKFPFDWTFFATAAAFSGKKPFERGRPVA